MAGFVAAEQGHIVPLIYPNNVAGGATSDTFCMREYSHATIICMFGTTADDPTSIILKECTSKAGGGNAIAFNAYKCETTGAAALADVLGVRTAVLATGIDPPTTNNIFYVIELDASELTAGYEWVELVELNGAANINLFAAVAILSGARYAGEASRTVLDN